MALLIGLVVLFRVYHLEQYLSLDYIKSSQEQFAALYAQHQVLVIGAYFPFFVVNLLMGLTRMPLRTFYWVSQVGMLAGTAVYVNGGKKLAKIDSLSGILSPSLLISFALLGLLPITVKKLMAFFRSMHEKLATA